MKIIGRTEESPIATVFIAEDESGRKIEFVESTQPPLTHKEKWVLIISTLYGCPVDCSFCDAGGKYLGRVGLDALRHQVDYAVGNRWPDGFIDAGRFKIQFARMGEPAFNPFVLDFLEEIPGRYRYRHFIPSLSTIAPHGTEKFFERLLGIKKRLYDETFQLQFSIHTLDPEQRETMIPVKKWSFAAMQDYAKDFYSAGGKKLTLNFALTRGSVLDPEQLSKHFGSDVFLIKITPVNPTAKARKNGIDSLISRHAGSYKVVEDLRAAGYEVILSIGEWEENQIGSNCGQYVNGIEAGSIDGAYCYRVIGV